MYQLVPTQELQTEMKNMNISQTLVQEKVGATPDILIQHTCMAETSLLESTNVKNQVSSNQGS